jgi:phospholipid-binding lipoprotein MlaA
MGTHNRFLTGKGCFGKIGLLTALFFFSMGCATTQDTDKSAASKPADSKSAAKSDVDPYEDVNRSIFKFNNQVDNYVAKPISDAYLWISPSFVKTGITNFFINLKDINVVLNDNMQGKFEQGVEDTGRLLTNTTLGLLGFFDVATDLGLKKHEEDFGQTLAVWGVPQGSYLVLPLLGPTTTRGVPGGLLDAAANPTSYVGAPVQLVSMLNTRANAEGALKFIDEAAIDPYLFTREAYLQNQQHLISDGKYTGDIDILPLEAELKADLNAAIAEDEAKSTKTQKVASPKSDANKSLTDTETEMNKASRAFEQSLSKLDKLEKSKLAKHKHHKKKPLPPAPTGAEQGAQQNTSPAKP